MVRSIGGGSASWHMTSSWMNLPRLTIEVRSGSEAAHSRPGCVSIPARPSAAGQVALTKVVSLVGGRARERQPGIQAGEPPVDEHRLRREQLVDGAGRVGPQRVGHELPRGGVAARSRWRSDPGRRWRERREQAGVLRLLEHLPDVEPVDDDAGEVLLDGGQRQQAIDLRADAGGGRQAPVVGRRRQLGVGKRAEEQEAELAGDLVRGQRRVGELPARRRRSASAARAPSGRRTTAR